MFAVEAATLVIGAKDVTISGGLSLNGSTINAVIPSALLKVESLTWIDGTIVGNSWLEANFFYFYWSWG
jgi:hypothetical protein